MLSSGPGGKGWGGGGGGGLGRSAYVSGVTRGENYISQSTEVAFKGYFMSSLLQTGAHLCLP